jgi:PAS domain S-box-containing protein
MGDGFIAIDPQGTISLINEAAEKIFRKQPEEMAGRPATALFESVDPESRLILEALVPEVLEKGAAGTSPENLMVDGPRGETIHLSETHAPIRDESGNIVGAVFVFRDITGKWAEMALQESERRYKFLVDNTRDIIFTLDAEGQFTFVSPAWSKLLGNEPQEVLSQSFRPFIHPDDLPACESFLMGLRLENQPEPSVEYRVRHVDGGWRWHTARGALVSNADGVPSFIGVPGTLRSSGDGIQAEPRLMMEPSAPLQGASPRFQQPAHGNPGTLR